MTAFSPGNRRVIPAAEFGLVSEAAEFLAAARRTAEASAEEARTAREEARREGFEQGYADGLRETAEALLAVKQKAQQELLDLESWIVPVVLKAVDLIVGGMEPDERVRRLIARAIKDVTDQEPLTLRVPPEEVALARRAIGDAGRPVAVVADAALDAGEIVMETPAGRSHIGMREQIAALAEQTSRE
ncbi:Type III secretion cytoplasmic protein (YscL) (plasmid) [Sinorhizobium sojae CCBAU 05684]|uniref:Type 3 secretion system stator protein n=1 Tax=Sinorhizobium sojae CCBAU 05684 TaxID=716928 RepID=A0A249PJ17_9HYPH|nr:type III secretion system stator protein SctL [Sinorhizobium sojae]ASY65732.1 Type III secretion cytoplasmic protein (YscL) [Sinorhizobium sojae CCBAU 05684]